MKTLCTLYNNKARLLSQRGPPELFTRRDHQAVKHIWTFIAFSLDSNFFELRFNFFCFSCDDNKLNSHYISNCLSGFSAKKTKLFQKLFKSKRSFSSVRPFTSFRILLLCLFYFLFSFYPTISYYPSSFLNYPPPDFSFSFYFAFLLYLRATLFILFNRFLTLVSFPPLLPIPSSFPFFQLVSPPILPSLLSSLSSRLTFHIPSSSFHPYPPLPSYCSLLRNEITLREIRY